MSENLSPLELDFKSANPASDAGPNRDGSYSLRTFNSYSFERSILTPALPFRFTAPGVEPQLRQAIRSGDFVTLWAKDSGGKKHPIGVGIVDETDTHITPKSVEYVLTGRDLLGQLVDNAAVDANNKVISLESQRIDQILGLLIQNTRLPADYWSQQTPSGVLVFRTNPGETKINALQRYFEFTNCLVWTLPNGQAVVGKPDFVQQNSGIFILDPSNPDICNVLEARVRRNINQTIRQIVTQLQTQSLVPSGRSTTNNNDQYVRALAPSLVGRSVYNVFSYGQGADAVNQNTHVGNIKGNPHSIGEALSLREIARENMKVLDVEVVVKDHFNENGEPYDIDQMYSVFIPDDEVDEDMYVYHVSYELTMDHGMLTRLRLCRKGTICAASAIISGGQKS